MSIDSEEYDERLVDERAACWHLGMSHSKLKKLRYRKEGPTYVKMGRQVRYRMVDLNQYIRENSIRNESG